MQIGILASPERKAAWLRLASEDGTWTWAQDTKTAQNFDWFIDLDFDSHPEHMVDYVGNTQTTFLLSSVNCTPLQALHAAGLTYNNERFFGINAIPTFLERKTLEISNPFQADTTLLSTLPWWETLEWVQSRVGMVTPRVVFMIINEAYYTVQEGTAAKADIDTAMKLGTAYPKGPFEWCQAAGIDNVYQTLKAVYEDTKDERYKICPALQTEWLMGKV